MVYTEVCNEPERLLRLGEVKRVTGLCRSAIYECIKEGSFPTQVSLGGSRAVGWVASEVNKWVQCQIAATPRATASHLADNIPPRQIFVPALEPNRSR